MTRPIMSASAAILAVAALSAPAHAQVQAQDQPQRPAYSQPLPEVERVQPDVGALGVSSEPADPARFACRMNLIHLMVAIAPETSSPSWLPPFLGGGKATPASVDERVSCFSLLDEPLVRFDSDHPPSPTWGPGEQAPR